MEDVAIGAQNARDRSSLPYLKKLYEITNGNGFLNRNRGTRAISMLYILEQNQLREESCFCLLSPTKP